MTQATASIKDKVSEEEWQARTELAAVYRLVALYGWDDLIFTHISMRMPHEDGHFLINPYGFLFEEITASSLVKVNLQGDIVSETEHFINPAGFTIHSAVHAARHDVACVLHTHSLHGVAVSAQKDGLLPLSQQSLFPLSGLAYHDYEGVALNEAEKPRLVADLGAKNLMILRNHGLLTCGKTAAQAFCDHLDLCGNALQNLRMNVNQFFSARLREDLDPTRTVEQIHIQKGFGRRFAAR